MDALIWTYSSRESHNQHNLTFILINIQFIQIRLVNLTSFNCFMFFKKISLFVIELFNDNYVLSFIKIYISEHIYLLKVILSSLNSKS